MKLSTSALDSEIQAVEHAIAADRKLLEGAFVGYVEGVRETAVTTITSPKFLLGALGVGFIAGKFLFRGKKRRKQDEGAPVKNSLLALLGAGTFSLVQAQFGGPVGLAHWITTRIYQARRSARHAATEERSMPRAARSAEYGARYAGETSTEHPAALLRR